MTLTFAKTWSGCIRNDVAYGMAKHPDEFPRLDDRHIGAAVILAMESRNLTCTDAEFSELVETIKPLLKADRDWNRKCTPHFLRELNRPKHRR